LNDHDKSDLITKVIPVTYDPNAECPKWLGFLDKIMDGNQELISFLQRTVGYALTGDTREQCFFILHGDGANGKSTFIKTIGALLGDYAQAASFETFLSKNQGNVANNDIARMQGKRFISAVEAEESRRLAENVIKQVTGGDVVAARFLYREYFEFVPQFKIFLTTNHKPKINCNDPAIWRRVKLIPFTVSIPEEKQILDLDEQLKDEFSGILNWAIEGCLDWQRNGLQTPEEVVNATKDYRNEMDTVNEFLEECCTLLPNVKVNPTALFDAYKKFCEKNGEIFLSMKKFGASLNKKGYEVTKTNSRTWRLGIGLPVEERANDYSEWSD
jgi:putative DNA primase/helicase